MQDVVVGGGLLGAGGGGSIVEGLKLVERVLEFAPHVDLLDVDEADDDGWGALVAGMGSPLASINQIRTYSPTYALEGLENALGFESAFVIPFEVGAGNSINPMIAAVQKGIPVIDGDPAGRAVPEIQITKFHLGGIPLAPFSLANEDKIFALLRTEKPYDVERVGRAITAELGGVAAFACHAVQGKEMKKNILSGTTTLAERCGAKIRESRDQGNDIATALIETFGGFLLGKGEIASIKGETKGAFDFGAVEVTGELPIKVLYKNENMLAYRGEQLLAVVPDLICSIDENGNPLTNADLKEKMKITYIGLAANPDFRSVEVFALFKHILSSLGYHDDFVPIEELMDTNS
jgi:DUF917 family protein